MYYRSLKKKNGEIRYHFQVRVRKNEKTTCQSKVFDSFQEGATWFNETKKEIELKSREPTLMKRIEVLEDSIMSIQSQIDILLDHIKQNSTTQE